MKILIEGIHIWKSMIPNITVLLKSLIFIYFHYNTSEEHWEILKDNPTL